MKRITIFLTALVLVLSGGYTARAAATALVAPSDCVGWSHVITFDGMGFVYPDPVSLVAGVQFELGTGVPPTYRDDPTSRECGLTGSGSIDNFTGQVEPFPNLIVTFPELINRVSFEARSIFTGEVLVHLLRSGTVVETVSVTFNGPFLFYYYGIETTQAFDQIEIDLMGGANRRMMVDNIRYDLTLVNDPPVANAGPDRTVHLTDTVTLDGGASTDPNGDVPLSYFWTLVSKPAGSAAALDDPTLQMPSFVADTQGDYVVELVVTDTLGFPSTPDTVLISTSNTPPVANAGPDQSVHPGETAFLDGTGSTDGELDYPLTYAWSFVSMPAGSAAALSDPSAAAPSFAVDEPGDYVLELVVTDSLGAASAPDTVTVSTTNAAPVANAGPDQAVTLVGSTITLDGSASSDPDGDSIGYEWVIQSKPAGSAAALSNPTVVAPTFIADVNGDYVISLVVRDLYGAASAPDSVTVSFNNLAPVADAGADQTVGPGDTAALDGSGSSDANGDPLTYMWSLVSAPAGSGAVLTSTATVTTSLTTDLPGTYVVSLIVNDGLVNSTEDTVTIEAVSAGDEALLSLIALVDTIKGFPDEAFKHAHFRRNMVRRLEVAIKLARHEKYVAAAALVGMGLLPRTDGCARRNDPDRNDWIVGCDYQAQVDPVLRNAFTVLWERGKAKLRERLEDRFGRDDDDHHHGKGKGEDDDHDRGHGHKGHGRGHDRH